MIVAGQCINGAIRLVGGNSSNEGTVELCMENEWGTVCDDLFDINDANVVCRQLGYPGAIQYHRSAYYGQGSGPIWLDNVYCEGTEASIYNCTHPGFGNHDCRHWDDVGVECKGM